MGYRYKKEQAGADGWSEWVRPVEQGYRMMCCDCCLVHVVDHRLVTDPDGERHIEMRFRRDDRATAGSRRGRDNASKLRGIVARLPLELVGELT